MNVHNKANEPFNIIENKFAKAFLQNSVPMTISTIKDGRYIDVSDAFITLMGLSRDEVIGNTSTGIGFITAEQRSLVLNELEKKGRVENLELQVRTKCSELRYGLFNSTIITIADQDHLLTVVTDITDRNQAQEALKASEAKYRRLHDTMRDAFVVVDMKGNITEFNEAYRKMLGYETHELLKLSYQDLIPDKWHAIEDVIVKTQILSLGYSDLYEKEYLRKDGTVFPVELRTVLISDDAGEPTSMWAIVRDITEHKRVGEALRQANEYNRSLIEASLDPLVTFGPDGRITDANTATEQATGCSRNELIGTDFSDYFTDPDKARNGYQKVFREGLVRDYDLDLRHRDGQFTSVLYNASVYRDSSGQVAGVIAAARDISELKKAGDALRESEAKYRFLTEKMYDIIWTAGLDFRITYDSPSVERLLGYTPQERLGQKITEMLTQESYAHALEVLSAELKRDKEEGVDPDRMIKLELDCYHKNGSMVWMECIVSAIRDHTGKICGYHGMSRDITDRKHVELELKKHREQLEWLINERTAELSKAYDYLKLENEARKSSENELRSREMELEKGRRELEEMNSALKVLLKQREEDKANMEMNIISNIKTSVLPYIEKLESSGLAEGQMRVSSMIKSLLGEITSPFIKKVSSEFLGFTPNEIQVASLVKEGKSSKEIAEILNISLNTVHTYRYKIRIKTGLKNNKVNLRSYLQILG